MMDIDVLAGAQAELNLPRYRGSSGGQDPRG